MYFDAELYNDKVKPWETVTYFINKTLPRLGWNSDEPEVVMDVGSGPGNISKNYILPAFPNLKKLIAMDATPSMIEVAKLRHPHSNIEYVVANLEDRATIKEWMGQITKLISIHCFNWLKDQKSGFQASYDLLKPGGEAAFLFGLQPPYYNGIIETGNHPKYNSYLKGVDFWIPESYRDNYDESNYKKMLDEIGFKILLCKVETKEDIFPSDQAFKDMFYSVCPLVKHLPENLKEDFKNDLFENILKHYGRSKDGLPIHRRRTVEIFVRKEN